MDILETVQQKPVTTGLVVIGVGALALFAFGGAGQANASAVDANGLVIQGASPEQVAANTSLLIAQMQSSDERYFADLNARVRLAERAVTHEETLATIALADRTDIRRVTESTTLASLQAQLAQQQQETARQQVQQEQETARQQSRDNRRANRDTQIGAAIGTIALVVLAMFGY